RANTNFKNGVTPGRVAVGPGAECPPLAHSQYAKNGKALNMPPKERGGLPEHTHALTSPRGCLHIGYSRRLHQCRTLATSARVNCCDTPNFDNDTRRPCAFSSCGFSSSSSYWDDGDVTRSMRSVPSAIKWCVCITIRPAGDIYSPTRVHTRAPCMKDRVTGRTIRRRLNVSVRACWPSSTRAQMKVNNSGCQNPLSSKAKQVLIIEHRNECRFQ